MFKNKLYLSGFYAFYILFFLLIFTPSVYASPSIASFLLNNTAQNITFDPNKGETVSIEIKANTPVKFTRLYICSMDQICNGTSGNYTRYFTQSDVSNSITKIWNGKKSGDTEIVQAGEYRVMVSMTEGTNDPVLEFGLYSIFVGQSISTSTVNETNSTSTTTTITQTVTPTLVRTVYVSSHSNQEDLSDYNPKISFEASAGRERMALVGSIIEFDAKYIINQKDQCNPIFKWSYGDGFESVGKFVSHVYKYSGEYNVVLNALCGEHKSISRTIIKILSPNVAMVVLPSGDIEITNKGKHEINIGGWKIKGGLRDFIFSQDTIIFGNNKIIISKEDIGESDYSDVLSLINHSGKEVVFVSKPRNTNVEIQNIPEVIDDSISVEQAEILLAEYKNNLKINKNKDISVLDTNDDTKALEDVEKIEPNNTASVLESKNNVGIWRKVIQAPLNGLKSILNRFYNF